MLQIEFIFFHRELIHILNPVRQIPPLQPNSDCLSPQPLRQQTDVALYIVSPVEPPACRG